MGNKKKIKSIVSVSLNENKNRFFVYLLFLLLVPSVLYFRVVNFDFSTFDDNDIIVAHFDTISDLKNIKEAFTHDAFMSNIGDSFYRPVQTISFMLDAQGGGKEPWIYHLSNLLLHILTVIALFFFLKRIGVKIEISFFLSLFFSIHPLFTHAVAWIPARGDLLLALFSLLSFITFLEYYKNRKLFFLILHTILFLLALLSKESAILLPPLILTYYYFAVKNKFILNEILHPVAVWCFSLLLFFYLRLNVVKVKLNPDLFGAGPFIKNLSVIPVTFGKFFVPQNLATMPLYDIVSLIIGIISITTIVFLAFKLNKDKEGWKIIIWGAIWFFVFTLPSMIIRPYIADFGYEYFEYRTYLPMIGILIIMGIICGDLLNNYSFNSILKVSIPVILIYGAVTFFHITVFSDPVSFYTSAINANPKNALALNLRGHVYSYAGMTDKALVDFDKAINICPEYSNTIFNKAEVYNTLGDNSRAEELYSQALNYDTLYPNLNNLGDNAYISLSAEKIVLKKYNEALIILNKAKNKYPVSDRIFNNMGYVYSAIGEFDSALFNFNRAILLEPAKASYYNNRAKAKYHLKDYNGSLSDFQKAVELDPDSRSGETYYYLGMAFSKLNRLSEAKENLDKAEKLGYKAKDLNE
jgi:protein O-mannosyl-transferase